MRRLTALGSLVLFGCRPFSATDSQIDEYPEALVRERQTVTVDGIEEIWELRWKSPPESFCGEPPMAITCPCAGFGYGEAGELELVRLREGTEVDRLSLASVFVPEFPESVGIVAVQRSEFLLEELDAEDGEEIGPEVIRGREVVQIMRYADYDHDGRATEFYLQTVALACGKRLGVVVGLSRENPRLHVFGTASSPEKPLYLMRYEWEALRNADGPLEVMHWPCRDHGSDIQETVELSWTEDGIDGVRREYQCTANAEAGDLVDVSPL